MKRRRNIGILVIILLVLAAAATILGQAYQQNARVRRDLHVFFTAIQQHNLDLVARTYEDERLYSAYQVQVVRYKLLGWEITEITGQPFPADVPAIGPGGRAMYHIVKADLYYSLPDELMKPNGPYQRIKHAKYGECAVVPVALEFAYRGHTDTRLKLASPSLEDGKNWTAPFAKLTIEPFK